MRTRVMVRILLLVPIASLVASCQNSQPPTTAAATEAKAPSSPLEGTWREAEIVTTGRDAATIANPQPSLYVFTATHYAMLGTYGDKSRALFKAREVTKDEKVAAYDSFWGNAGTYEMAGDTLTIRPIVAKDPNFMAGGSQRLQLRVEGDQVWLTRKSTETYRRVGDQVVPDPGPLSEARTKLVRVR